MQGEKAGKSSSILWSAIDSNDAKDPHFSFSGKYYVQRDGILYEGDPVAGGDYSLSEVPPNAARQVLDGYSQHAYETGPKELPLESPYIDPVDVLAAGITGG